MKTRSQADLAACMSHGSTALHHFCCCCRVTVQYRILSSSLGTLTMVLARLCDESSSTSDPLLRPISRLPEAWPCLDDCNGTNVCAVTNPPQMEDILCQWPPKAKGGYPHRIFNHGTHTDLTLPDHMCIPEHPSGVGLQRVHLVGSEEPTAALQIRRKALSLFF